MDLPGTGEWQAKGNQLQDDFRSRSADVQLGLSIPRPVRANDGVGRVPAPVNFGHVGQRYLDATLCSPNVGPRREHQGEASRFRP